MTNIDSKKFITWLFDFQVTSPCKKHESKFSYYTTLSGWFSNESKKKRGGKHIVRAGNLTVMQFIRRIFCMHMFFSFFFNVPYNWRQYKHHGRLH